MDTLRLLQGSLGISVKWKPAYRDALISGGDGNYGAWGVLDWLGGLTSLLMGERRMNEEDV